MRNVLTIFRRDFAAFFTSPIGYIFIIVFLLISVGLYITAFFTFPVADMRTFFGNLPIILCVFIPAVTMRVWAEERKENTWELLLTFPMRARELVLGKFLSTLAFLAVTLAGTITVPVMLIMLGNPDGGAVWGGYLGAFMLGAFFLAIGIFFSGFCRDQIVAFVVTLLACFAIFLVGTNFIASYIDGVIPGLGSLLGELVGVIRRYDAFGRGVVSLPDVLYFAAWTVLFLGLNIMFIDGRNRPGARTTFVTAVALCVGIGLAFNWLLSGQSFGRFDLTEDKIYTVTDASKNILSKLKAPVQVKVYITPKSKMPTAMKQLEQGIVDKLEELRLASDGKIEHSVVHMEVANLYAGAEDESADDTGEGAEDKSKAIEKRMKDKGVTPFTVRAIGEDEVMNKLVYSSIGVGYGAKAEEIIPQVMPENLPELEYRLVNTIYKLTREKAPVVALVAPKEAVNIPPEMRRLYEQMGQSVPSSEDPYVYLEQVLRYEKYDVQRVDLTQDSPLPDEYDTLVVVNPRGLNDRQRWEINRALHSGKSVFIAAQNYTWDYQATGRGLSITKREETPGVNDLLKNYGVGVDEDILMDTNHVPLTIQTSTNPLAMLLGGGQTINLPTQIIVHSDSMDQQTSITQRLSTLFYLWGSALTLDEDQLKKHTLEAKTLMSSGEKAWKVPSTTRPSDAMFTPPGTRGNRYPLMVLVTGQFPDAYKDKPRPAWPPAQPSMPGHPPLPPRQEDPQVKPVEPKPGKLILLGCAEMFRKNFLQSGNLDLFLNSIDALTLGDELVNVRSRKPIDRTIAMPAPATRRLWKSVNYVVMNAVVAAVGITTAIMRRRARYAYTLSYSNAPASE